MPTDYGDIIDQPLEQFNLFGSEKLNNTIRYIMDTLKGLSLQTAGEVDILEYDYLIPNKALYPESKDWDISLAMQKAIDDIVASGKRTFIKTKGRRFKWNNPVVLDVSYVSLDGGGSTFDAAALQSGTALKFTGSKLQDGLPDLDQYAAYVGEFSLEGDSTQSRGRVGTTGFEFDSSTEAGVPGLSIMHTNVGYFENGHVYKSRTYTINFFGCRISKCTNGEFIPRNMTDYGERISHFGCTLANCTNILVGQSGGMHYDTCSWDYPTQKYVDLDGCQVSLYNCHIEGRINQWTDPPFLIRPTYGATLTISGGIFLLSTGSPTHDYLFDIQSAPEKGGGVIIRDSRLHNLQTKTKFLAKGSGFLLVDCKLGNENTQMAKFTIDNDFANLFCDGDMEDAAITDLLYISSDTKPIVAPYGGESIKIEKSTDYKTDGTQSLKITKIGAKGATAAITLAVPIPKHAKAAVRYSYKKPNAGTGNVIFNAYYGRVHYGTNGSGLPYTTTRSDVIGSLPVTFTTAAVEWKEETDLVVTTPHTRAPAWATHFIVTINLTDFSPDVLYLDKLFASAY